MNNDLIARLEAATGPDWRLDVALAEHYYLGDRDMHRAAMEGRWKPTASIDAALTLVPDQRGPWSAWNWAREHIEGAFTPALAICIAALKAKENSNG